MRQWKTKFATAALIAALCVPTSPAQQGKDLRPPMTKAKPSTPAKAPTAPQPKPTPPSPPPEQAPAPMESSVPQRVAITAQPEQQQMKEIPAQHVLSKSVTLPTPVASQVVVSSAPPPTPPATLPRRDGILRTESYYPSGDRNTSAILLERSVPAEVRVGESYSYEIKLTNLTSVDIRSLELTEQMPSVFKMSDGVPSGSSAGSHEVKWSIGTLGARQSTSIKVTGAADGAGELRYCATVTFQTELCSTHRIVQPELLLTMSAPSEVILCDSITLRYVVTNRGSGVARNVKVVGAMPSGLATQDGRSSVTFDAGSLAAGQSREFTVAAKATSTGSFTSTAQASEDGGLSAQASVETSVIVPKLVLSKTGPEERYLGRPATYEIVVSNDGDAPAKDTIIVDELSSGHRIVETSMGGQAAGGRVTWNLGTIPPGSQQRVSLTVVPDQIGTIRNSVSAKAYCAEAVAETTTEIRGISAMLLEVVDNDDPIEVGALETYDIMVTNQGSADGTNIVIACTVPPEQEYVSANGPTPATLQGNIVRFAPLQKLAPKTTVIYKVVVRGVEPADVRFRVSMTSDQLTTPVDETESTHVYK